MSYSDLLNGAYDMHVHSLPDVISRSQDPLALLKEAQEARMAGIVLKDHTTSTVGRVFALNKQRKGEFKFYSSLCLNPPTGDINPSAVESSVRAGVDIVFLPSRPSAQIQFPWKKSETKSDMSALSTSFYHPTSVRYTIHHRWKVLVSIWKK